jgi:hypothetical protein
MAAIDSNVRASIDDKIVELKRCSYTDLQQLPKCSEEVRTVNESTITLAIWKDEVEERTLRIVVQAYRRSSFPGLVGLTQADGFRMRPDGAINGVSADELLEFS